MRRNRRQQASAAHLTAAEAKQEARRAQLIRQRKLIRRGQVLMGIGVLVGLMHLLAHFEVFGGPPSGLVDLLVGYPMAGVAFVSGAILAGQ